MNSDSFFDIIYSMKIPRRIRVGEVVLKICFLVSVVIVTAFFVGIVIIDKQEPEKAVSFCESFDECSEETMPEEVVAKPDLPYAGTIYLTFDDGPGDYTEELLDVLKKYGVKATFFVTSKGDDAVILREYQEGHTVALHSFSHNYAYVYANADNYFEDLYAVQARVKAITGQTAKLLRFPGGSSNTVSRRYDHRTHIMSYLTTAVEELGFTYFDWNVDSDDAGSAREAGEVYENVISRLKAGEESVVLQHDIKDYSVAAVESIIQYGFSNGYVFERLTADSFTAHHGVNN